MKRIIQIVQRLQPGGIETMALDLQHFAEAGEEVYIISLEGSKEEACAAWPRLANIEDKLIFLDKPPGLKFGTILSLKRHLHRLRPVAVHTHHIGPLLYGGLAARLEGIKTLIHTEHDTWHLGDSHARFLQRLALMLTRPKLVAVGQKVAQELKKWLPNVQTTVILNGIDTQRFKLGEQHVARQKLALPQKVRLIGCAARLHPVKGHQFLLNAVFKLDKNIHLALAGEGELRQELQRKVIEAGEENRVHFLGRVDEMPTFYQALDVFCLPSLAEGLPLSPLEAQACGIFAVVSDVGGASETLCPKTGQLVPSHDTQALVNALKASLDNRSNINPRTFITASANIQNVVHAYAALRR